MEKEQIPTHDSKDDVGYVVRISHFWRQGRGDAHSEHKNICLKQSFHQLSIMQTLSPTMFDLLRSDVLKHVEMSDEEFKVATTFLIPKKLRRRQYLLQAGDVCRWLSFISKGCLRHYVSDDAGTEHIIGFGVEGSWMTDLDSYRPRHPSTTNIDALEDSELLLVESESLSRLYAVAPLWERYFMEVLALQHRAALARISDFVSASAEERYLRFLKIYPDLFQRVPLHQIASFLGVTPQTLSRIRKELSKRM